MRRRQFLWLLNAGWLGGLVVSRGAADAHKEDSLLKGRTGRQAVKISTPDFTLTDQDGQPFSLRDWRGRVVIVTFGFTTCVDVCPLLAANLAVIQRELPEAARPRTGLLLITSDPEYDTPAILRQYGERFGADFETWKFLTGTVEELEWVWKGFGVAVKKRGPGQVDHTTLTTIVDPEGIRRVNYFGTRWSPQTLMSDLVAWARRMPMRQ
jgi:protein SCO1/2